MGRCEVCLTRDDLRTCGFDDQPMLDFCTPHWIWHVETAHPGNEHAQREVRELKARLTTTQQGDR